MGSRHQCHAYSLQWKWVGSGDLGQGYEEYADRYVKDVVQALRESRG